MDLRKLAISSVIASATILGGCTVPMVKVGGYEGLTRVGEDNATVYVYRGQSFVGSASLDSCKNEIAPLNYVIKREQAKALGLVTKRQSVF